MTKETFESFERLKQFELSLYNIVCSLYVDECQDRWAIYYPDGTKYDYQTYKTAAAAKRALTAYKKVFRKRYDDSN